MANMRVKVSWVEEWERTEVLLITEDEYREWAGESGASLRDFVRELDVEDWHPGSMPVEADSFVDLTVTSAVET